MPNARKAQDSDFTVLMAVYSKDDIRLFQRAVSSVYENTLLPSAMVLVVDGPVSGEFKFCIKAMQALYSFDVLWLPENVGLANALNKGLELVSTDWIARADADDFNCPNRFEQQVQLSKCGFDLIGSAIEEVDQSGKKIALRTPPLEHFDIKRFARYRSPFNHMTVFYRTSLVKQCGGYPQIYLKEDYGLWALMISKGARLANSRQVLVVATSGIDMIKRRGGIRYAKAEIHLQSHLVLCGIKGHFSAVFQGSIRAMVFLLPPTIRGYIYKFFLRNNY
jgi:glycosyltransferase involved in cell wall biosynthesis